MTTTWVIRELVRACSITSSTGTLRTLLPFLDDFLALFVRHRFHLSRQLDGVLFLRRNVVYFDRILCPEGNLDVNLSIIYNLLQGRHESRVLHVIPYVWRKGSL